MGGKNKMSNNSKKISDLRLSSIIDISAYEITTEYPVKIGKIIIDDISCELSAPKGTGIAITGAEETSAEIIEKHPESSAKAGDSYICKDDGCLYVFNDKDKKYIATQFRGPKGDKGDVTTGETGKTGPQGEPGKNASEYIKVDEIDGVTDLSNKITYCYDDSELRTQLANLQTSYENLLDSYKFFKEKIPVESSLTVTLSGQIDKSNYIYLSSFNIENQKYTPVRRIVFSYNNTSKVLTGNGNTLNKSIELTSKTPITYDTKVYNGDINDSTHLGYISALNGTFRNCYVTDVKFPRSLKVLSDQTFYANLTAITSKFNTFNIDTIDLYEISDIGIYNFDGCYRPKKFIVSPDNERYFVNDEILYDYIDNDNKDKLRAVKAPYKYSGGSDKKYENSDVYDIHTHAFENTQIKDLSCENCVTIQSWAFLSATELTNIVLPNVQSIAYGAFAYAKKNIGLSCPNIKNIGIQSFMNNDRLKYISCENCITIDKMAFYNHRRLTEVSCPNLTSIGQQAFYISDKDNNTNYIDFHFPKCNNIMPSAFMNISIENIEFSPDITSIQNYAFANSNFSNNCNGFLNLPNIKTIYTSAFRNINSGISIDLSSSSNLTVKANAFRNTKIKNYDGCSAIISSCIGANDYSFYDSFFSDKFVDARSLTSTGKYSFANNYISGINLDSCKTILSSSFLNTKIEELHLPNISVIEQSAFYVNTEGYNVPSAVYIGNKTDEKNILVGKNAFGSTINEKCPVTKLVLSCNNPPKFDQYAFYYSYNVPTKKDTTKAFQNLSIYLPENLFNQLSDYRKSPYYFPLCANYYKLTELEN